MLAVMCKDDHLYVQSIAKAFAVHRGPLSLKDLASISRMDGSSAQRMTFTLTALGCLHLEKDEGKSYSLGR